MTQDHVLPEGYIIFLHIPRTGGVTFADFLFSILDHKYVYYLEASRDSIDNFENLSLRSRPQINSYFGSLFPREKYQVISGQLMKKKNIKVIFGHMRFGIHQYLPYPSNYITFFRDPIDRTISHYNYISKSPNHYLLQLLLQKEGGDTSISKLSPYLSNWQTRLLSGTGLNSIAWDDSSYWESHGSLSEEDLQKAKINLQQHFAAFGITERYDESLIMITQKLGWPFRYYTKKNYTKAGIKKDDISEDTLREIAKQNEIDIELYKFAQSLFEREIADQPKEFFRAVKLLNLTGNFAKIIDLANKVKSKVLNK